MFSYYYKVVRDYFSLGVTKPHLLVGLLVSGLLTTAAYATLPYIISMIVETATDGNFSAAGWWCLALLIGSVIYISCRHLNFWMYYKNAVYIHDELQRRILEKVTTMPEGFTEDISHASIINTAFADIAENQRIPDYFFSFFTSIIGMIISVAVLCTVDQNVGTIAGVLTVVSMALFTHHMKRRDYHAATQRSRQDDISDLYSQMIDGHKEVHTFNMKAQLREYFERDKELWQSAYLRKRRHQDLADAITPIILGLGRISLYLFAAWQILQGEYGVSMLVLVVGYYEQIQSNYEDAVGKVYYLSKCSVAIARVKRLLHYRTPQMIEFGNNNTDDIKGQVEFRRVNFTYGKQAQMRDVSFTIPPHSLTAIVGKSGSGKSTIFRLLLRLYKVKRGKILLDGQDIYDYTRQVYASNVSIVTQKPFIFDMTIRENLNLVDKDVEHQIAACKIAGIHDDIMRLEDGYNTKLVADAENLSAGQKQLLALARTLLSKSEVLLFDEVTSSLDDATSRQIIGILQKLKKTHTVLMITHKPDLMREADRILVISHGRLVGDGTHRELIKNNKYYQELQ